MTRNPSPIRALRTSHNLSQSSFAEAVGVTVHAVESWEQGTRNCPPCLLPLFETKLRLLGAVELPAYTYEELRALSGMSVPAFGESLGLSRSRAYLYAKSPEKCPAYLASLIAFKLYADGILTL